MITIAEITRISQVQLCKIKSSKSFGQRLTGGGYKGIPNGLKQSRPGKLCEFTVYIIRCCLPVTGTMLITYSQLATVPSSVDDISDFYLN